jgi:Co/Zn/Cd efflux system component
MAAVAAHPPQVDNSSLEEGGVVQGSPPAEELVHDVSATLSRAVIFNAVMEDALDARDKSVKETPSKERRWTPNIRALAVSAILFTTITFLQVFAAIKANSRALLMDCISMGIDAFTYMGNILVECKKRDGAKHVRSQLVIVAMSLGLLVYFTATAMQESWDTVQVCLGARPDEGGEEEVNGWITLVFALGGIGFDIACIVEFYKSNQKTGSIKQVNMFSAFLHVGADALRSTSTLVMSLLILIAHWDSTCLDAYTSVFIGITIIAGALTGLFKWLKMLIGFLFKTADDSSS